MILDGLSCLALSMIIYVLLNLLFLYLHLLWQRLHFLDLYTKLLVPYLLEGKSSLFNCYSKNAIISSFYLRKIVFAFLSHQ